MIKYYEFTEQEILDIRNYLPVDIAFGFVNYGAWFVSETEIENIDNTHGKILDLALGSVFNDTRDNVLTSKESTEYESYIEQKEKTTEGFDAYEKIIGYMVDNNELGSSLDNEIIPSYEGLTLIRMMLKDGTFELALRKWVTDIKPNTTISANGKVFIEDIIVTLCENYGTPPINISALLTVPKGSL